MTARAIALIFALFTLPALAQTPRPADAERLTEWETLLGRALRQALQEGDAADLSLLLRAMRGAPGPLDPAGEWECRVLKLGGLTALTVYRPFRCRITPQDEGGWLFEKLSGSQRSRGTIHLVEGDAIYLGVGFVDGGPAVEYGALPPDDQTPVEPGQTYAQVGFFEQTGAANARLLLPDPVLESDFDILWLTR